MTDSPTRMPPLVSERLVIREFSLEDVEAAHRILDVEEAEGGEPQPIEQRRRLIEEQIASTNLLAALTQPPYGDRAMTLRTSGELIGVCGINPALVASGRFPTLRALGVLPDPRPFYPEVGLFWHVARGHRGSGYATEAGAALIRYGFEVMKLQRIVATTEYSNLASQAVMRRLGMTIERNPQDDPFWLQIVATLANPAVSGGSPFD